jgi:hypothetical protein
LRTWTTQEVQKKYKQTVDRTKSLI